MDDGGLAVGVAIMIDDSSGIRKTIAAETIKLWDHHNTTDVKEYLWKNLTLTLLSAGVEFLAKNIDRKIEHKNQIES